MWKTIRGWLKAPVFEGDPEKTRRAWVLWTVLWASMAAGPLYTISGYIGGSGGIPVENVAYSMAGVAFLLVPLLVVTKLGYITPVAYLLTIVFWLLGTAGALFAQGMFDPVIFIFYMVIALAGTTISVRALMVFSGLSILSLIAAMFLEHNGILVYVIESPTSYADATLVIMFVVVTAILLRNALTRLAEASAETQANVNILAETNTELQSVQATLSEQSADLVRRAAFLETTAMVAQETGMLLNEPEVLLNQIVTTVAGQLQLYHVGLYLIAPGGDFLRLVAASSDVGKQLVQGNFQLPVSDKLEDRSIPGWVVVHGEIHAASNVDEDPRFRVLGELLETRSEIALPLMSQGQVIGVLDFQSSRATVFREADAAMMQLLSGQVAMVINNAQLVSQLGEAVSTQRRLSGEIGRENWLELIRAGADTSFVSTDAGVEKGGAVWSQEMEFAVNTGKATVSPNDPRVLAIPVRARGEIVAVIDATLPEGRLTWTADAISSLETMAEQLGTALEGARLYQQTMQRATTEQMTREVTSAMRSSLNVNDVLQAALREISEVLEVQQVQVRLGTAEKEAGA